MRWVPIEASHQGVARCPALRRFFERIHRGKRDGYKKAVVATGRKVLSMAQGMMRTGVPFDPALVSRPVA